MSYTRMTITGHSIDELEIGPSSYRLKKQFFGSNRVGFDVVWDLAYKNLDHWNLAADWLMIFGPSSYRLFFDTSNCGDGGDRESTDFFI